MKKIQNFRYFTQTTNQMQPMLSENSGLSSFFPLSSKDRMVATLSF